MSLCKKDFIVNCTFVGGAGLVLVVVGWYRMRDTRLPGGKLEHVVGGEDCACGSQLLRPAVRLHDLMDCIVAARTPPRTFDSRDVFRLCDGRAHAIWRAKIFDVSTVVSHRVLSWERKAGGRGIPDTNTLEDLSKFVESFECIVKAVQS